MKVVNHRSFGAQRLGLDVFDQPVGVRLLADQLVTSVVHDPAIERFRRNAQGFWTAYRSLIVLFVIGLIFDAASTVHFMARLGASAEWHPAVRLAGETFGPVAGPILGAVGKAVACIYVTIYFRRYAGYILSGSAIIYLLAAWYNVWGMYLIAAWRWL